MQVVRLPVQTREPPGQFSIVVASSVAHGHYNTGTKRYEEFSAISANVRSLEEPERFQRIVEIGVSAVTNLALALELLLKILHFQHYGRYPSGSSGHDVSALGNSFPTATLETLRQQYATLLADPSKPAFLAFNLRAHTAGQTSESDWHDEPKNYDEAIERTGRAYVRWRYIYEEFGSTMDVSMSFQTLFMLCKTVDFAIKNHQGRVKVSITESPRSPSVVEQET